MRAGQINDVSPSRAHRRWSVAVAVALVMMATVVPAAGAAASTGSIPADVANFAEADDGLVLELEEYFGVNQRGHGLDFSDGIELGEIDRIFLWSEAYRSGHSMEPPVQYVNRWKIPVLIGDEPIGIAMIGIDPATVEPEMIDFIRSPGTSLALDDVDNDATLVYESETGAWFSLSDSAIVPLVRGDSGISGATTLAQYQSTLSSRVIEIVEPTPQPDQGSVQSVVLIVTTAVVLLLALIIPTILGQVRQRRERLAEAEAEAEAESDPSVAGSERIDAEIVAPSAEVVSMTDAGATADASAGSTATPSKPATKNAATKKPATKKTGTKPVGSAAVATKSAGKASADKKLATTSATSTATVKKPTIKSAESGAPAIKKPAAKNTVAKTPSSSDLATKKSAVTKSVAKKPAAKKPVAKKPAAKKPAIKKPAAPDSTGATEPSTD